MRDPLLSSQRPWGTVASPDLGEITLHPGSCVTRFPAPLGLSFPICEPDGLKWGFGVGEDRLGHSELGRTR